MRDIGKFIVGSIWLIVASSPTLAATEPGGGVGQAEGSTPWGWFAALTTAIFTLMGLFVAHRKEIEIERLRGENEVAKTRLSAEWEKRKDLELAHQNFIQTLRTDYDRDLRGHRIEKYQQLWALMSKLPKYPRPEPLSSQDLNALALPRVAPYNACVLSLARARHKRASRHSNCLPFRPSAPPPISQPFGVAAMAHSRTLTERTQLRTSPS